MVNKTKYYRTPPMEELAVPCNVCDTPMVYDSTCMGVYNYHCPNCTAMMQTGIRLDWENWTYPEGESNPRWKQKHAK